MAFSHAIFEKNAFVLIAGTVMVLSIGGAVEIIPLFTILTTVEAVKGVRPYTPLELIGRDIYIREGCYLCHSQQIRALRDEVERYGHYSLAAESMYDHPFQWGSKRIGPDVARVGGKYSNDWQYAHLKNPQALVPESLMPKFAFLAETKLDYSDIELKLKTQQLLGTPYTAEDVANARKDIETQADATADTTALLKRYPKAVEASGKAGSVTEMDALVAYLQVLGTMVNFADTSEEQLKQ